MSVGKLKLEDIEVESFVTELDDDVLKRVLGAAGADPNYTTCIDDATGGSRGDTACYTRTLCQGSLCGVYCSSKCP